MVLTKYLRPVVGSIIYMFIPVRILYLVIRVLMLNCLHHQSTIGTLAGSIPHTPWPLLLWCFGAVRRHIKATAASPSGEQIAFVYRLLYDIIWFRDYPVRFGLFTSNSRVPGIELFHSALHVQQHFKKQNDLLLDISQVRMQPHFL